MDYGSIIVLMNKMRVIADSKGPRQLISLPRLSRRIIMPSVLLLMIGGCVAAGLESTSSSSAATTALSAEPEAGIVTAPATVLDDSTASNGKIISFSKGGSSYNADLNFDFDTGDYSQWLATPYGRFEVGDPQTSHQTKLVTTTRNGQGYANLYEVHNNPAVDAASGTFRAVWGKYNTNDGPPLKSEVYWGFSVMLPKYGGQTAIPEYQHLWELHQRENIYGVRGTGSGNCTLAPHAVMVRNNRLEYRMMTGACRWNGTQWVGFEAYYDQQPILPSIALDTWYDVIVHIKFSEQSDGLLEVFARPAGSPWQSGPQLVIRNATLPYIPEGMHPSYPNGVHTYNPSSDGSTGLYLMSGLYTGSATWGSKLSQHYQITDNLRRYPTFQDAKAGFPAL